MPSWLYLAHLYLAPRTVVNLSTAFGDVCTLSRALHARWAGKTHNHRTIHPRTKDRETCCPFGMKNRSLSACCRARWRDVLKLVLAVAVTLAVWGMIIHLYWIQVGVRQDGSIEYKSVPVYSPLFPVQRSRLKPLAVHGVLTAFRGTLIANVRDLVRYTIKACEHFRLRCWLDSSTLLGSFRGGHIFAWEEDGDMGILAEDFKKLDALSKAGKFRAFARGELAGIEHPELTWDHGFDIIVRPGEDHLSARAVDRNTRLYIDFFKFQRVGPNIETPDFNWAWVHCAHCKTHAEDRRKFFSFPYSDVFPLQKCHIEGMEALCPKNTVSYLTYIFGHDFMNPPLLFRRTSKLTLYLLGLMALGMTCYWMGVFCAGVRKGRTL